MKTEDAIKLINNVCIRELKDAHLSAPLLSLDFHELTKGPVDDFKAIDENGNFATPFPCYKFITFDLNVLRCGIFNFQKGIALGIIIFIDLRNITGPFYIKLRCTVLDGEICHTAERISLSSSKDERRRFHKFKRGVDADRYSGVYHLINYAFMSQLMQPVEVRSPCANSGAVEFTQAIKHYTVVHRRHAANRKDVAAGSVIRDTTKQLTAHSRRAHFRILKSEKWGVNVGKKILVRACWVGPKEWIDAESKQIYRIANINPVPANPPAYSPAEPCR
jgi:hypothetical protein